MKTAFAAAALILAATGPGSAATVTVRVTGIGDAVGIVRVALCPEAEFLKTCRFTANLPAKAGRVDAVLRDVPPGRYAIQAHHDRDGDGRIGANLFGIPVEAVGFSRDAPMRFGPPRFEDAAVSIGSGGDSLTVPLRFGRD